MLNFKKMINKEEQIPGVDVTYEIDCDGYLKVKHNGALASIIRNDGARILFMQPSDVDF